MAKHKCPHCGNRFNYEQHGWMCPECGFIILGSTEANVFKEERLDEQRKKENLKRKSTASSVKGHSKKMFFNMLTGCMLGLVIIFGIGLSTKIPELIRKQEIAEKEADIVCTEVKMGETLSIAPYTLRFTQAFVPDWDALPKIDGTQYLAVDFITAGKNQENVMKNLSDTAWVCLHDVETDSYLVPQSVYQLAGSDENRNILYQMNVTGGLNKNEGTIIFLIQSPDREYELCVFAGEESDGYGRYDISVNEQYTVLLEITEQRMVNGS